MRVTGGRWSSRRLRGPSKGQKLRPTPDAMRERAFAVIGDEITGATVLDLFAGTGAVGIEALSRGAERAVFVEAHPSAVKLIVSNLETLEMSRDGGRVINRTADRAVRELARMGRVFDLVWADPPFESWTDGLDALVAAARGGLCAPGALLCLECPAEAGVEEALPRTLEIRRDLMGGASRVVMLRLALGTAAAPKG